MTDEKAAPVPKNQTLMLSLRTFRLASTTGNIVLFEAKVPRHVPNIIVPEAMAAGCMPVDADEIPAFENKERAKVEFQGDLRRSMVYMAVKAVMDKNDPKQFDGGHVPKHEVISASLGFDVPAKEVREIYQQYTAAAAEGRDYGLHPEAQNVLKVIEADSKAELVELAGEFGLEDKAIKGLTVKEIRKLLLVKLSGVAVSQE